MADTLTRTAPMSMGRIPDAAPSTTPEARRHTEGPVAMAIEEYTAQIPSDVYLWAAGASILGSMTLKVMGRDHGALFVGQWVAPFMLLGVYNKIVKTQGSDRVHRS